MIQRTTFYQIDKFEKQKNFVLNKTGFDKMSIIYSMYSDKIPKVDIK